MYITIVMIDFGDTYIQFEIRDIGIETSCLPDSPMKQGIVNGVAVTGLYPTLTYTTTQTYEPNKAYILKGTFINQTYHDYGCGTVRQWQDTYITCPPSGQFIMGWYGSGTSGFPAILDPTKSYPDNHISFIYVGGGRIIYAYLGCWNWNYGYPACSSATITSVTPVNGGYIRYLVEFKDGNNQVVFSQTYNSNPVVSINSIDSGKKRFKIISTQYGVVYEKLVDECPDIQIIRKELEKECPINTYCECDCGGFKICYDYFGNVIAVKQI